jgi:acyl carrier protein
VLGVKQVGIDDNFFDLGGQSLLAIVLINRIRTAFETDIAIKELFEAPTPADLAMRVKVHASSEP